MDSGANSYRRFLEGDRNSFTELVAEYWDGLTLYLTGFAESFSEAEELAEETFLKLYTISQSFRGKAPSRHGFSPWDAIPLITIYESGGRYSRLP